MLLFLLSSISCKNDELSRLNSTTENIKLSEQPNIEKSPVGSSRYAFYNGDLLYASDFGLVRFTPGTSKYQKVCTVPDCNHCLLDSSVIRFARMENEYLFFASQDPITGNYVYASRNFASDTTEIFFSCPAEVVEVGSVPYWDGEAFYFVCDKSIDVTDKVVMRSVENYSTEQIYTLTEGEVFVGVYEGYVITRSGVKVYATSYTDGKKFLLSDEDSFLLGSSSPQFMFFYEGRLIYQEQSGVTVSCYSNLQYPVYHLSCMDLNVLLYSQNPTRNDEGHYRIASNLTNFCIVGDKIYYTGSGLEYLYVPRDFFSTPHEVVESNLVANVYIADLPLEKSDYFYAPLTCTTGEIELLGEFTVLENRLYGVMRKFDKTTRLWSAAFWGELDFATKAVTVIDYREEEEMD